MFTLCAVVICAPIPGSGYGINRALFHYIMRQWRKTSNNQRSGWRREIRCVMGRVVRPSVPENSGDGGSNLLAYLFDKIGHRRPNRAFSRQ